MGFMGKSWEYMGIPSGKQTKSYWKMAIEIASFPVKSGDFPVRDVNVYQRVCMKHRVKPQKNSVYTKITYI